MHVAEKCIIIEKMFHKRLIFWLKFSLWIYIFQGLLLQSIVFLSDHEFTNLGAMGEICLFFVCFVFFGGTHCDAQGSIGDHMQC